MIRISCTEFIPVCLLLLLCSVPGWAEEAPQKAVLTDGVHLILKPETTTDSVSLTMFVRVRPDRTSEENTTGELVSHAFLYCNENSSFESIADTVQSVGGGLEIERTAETVVIRLRTRASRLNDAAQLLSQALKNANFSADALDKARHDVAESQIPRPGEPFQNALDLLRATFRPFPPPDAFQLQRIRPETAQAYFHSHYTADNVVIALVGNFVPKQAIAAFDNNFFDYGNVSNRPAMPVPPIASSLFDAPALHVLTTGRAAYALVAIVPPLPDSPDYPAFLTLHALLGVGHASRLFHAVRDMQGIGYEVNALYRPSAPELWTAYLQWDSKRPLTPDAALKLLNVEISGILKNPPTDEELQRARATAIGQTALRRESPRDESYLIGWYEVMGAGFDYNSKLAERLAAVSRDAILRVAKRYFSQRANLIALP